MIEHGTHDSSSNVDPRKELTEKVKALKLGEEEKKVNKHAQSDFS